MVEKDEMQFAFSNVREAIKEGAPDLRVRSDGTKEMGLLAEMVCVETAAIAADIVEEKRDYKSADVRDFVEAFDEFVKRVADGRKPRTQISES